MRESMVARSLYSITGRSILRTQWHGTLSRRYSAEASKYTGNAEDPEWFQRLRHEMLRRELPTLHDTVNSDSELKLAKALAPFLPVDWRPALVTSKRPNGKPPGSVGNHLIFFNPNIPASQLLPDGADQLHSPGEPFVRRMWAGGSIRVNPSSFFDEEVGWVLGTMSVCAERIKEVRLQGRDEKAKVFVTIERRFSRLGRRIDSTGAAELDKLQATRQTVPEQVKQEYNWGDAFLIEERTLVFLPARSAEELESFKTGNIKHTRYLQPPGEPEFSHALTPTSSLLSRFSKLTSNAHAIHLDREYCRTVEGYRNLLVHGPLSLLLVIKLISSHLFSLLSITQQPQFVQSIEYRNLAPLYCDEELRLCARERKALRDNESRTYDVWVQGPTGGMAVKGIVKTATIPKRAVKPRNKPKNLNDYRAQSGSKDTVRSGTFATTESDVVSDLNSKTGHLIRGRHQSIRHTKLTRRKLKVRKIRSDWNRPLSRFERRGIRRVVGKPTVRYLRHNLEDSKDGKVPRWKKWEKGKGPRWIGYELGGKSVKLQEHRFHRS